MRPNMIRGMLAALSLAVALGLSAAGATVVGPDEMRGLRSGSATGGRPILLTFSAVKTPTEDRTIAHFGTAGLGPWRGATLTIGLGNLDAGAPAGTLDLYGFAGDGRVSADEWNAGALLTTFTGIDGGNQTLRFDISGLLAASIDAGDPYLSFRMSTASRDRYALNSTIGGTTRSSSSEGPTFIELDVPQIPLPAGGLLILSGLGALALRRRHR